MSKDSGMKRTRHLIAATIAASGLALFATTASADCAAELELVGDPDELEALLCECGCGLVAIAFSEVEPAERVGFEPTRQVDPAHAISSRAP